MGTMIVQRVNRALASRQLLRCVVHRTDASVAFCCSTTSVHVPCPLDARRTVWIAEHRMYIVKVSISNTHQNPLAGIGLG